MYVFYGIYDILSIMIYDILAKSLIKAKDFVCPRSFTFEVNVWEPLGSPDAPLMDRQPDFLVLFYNHIYVKFNSKELVQVSLTT